MHTSELLLGAHVYPLEDSATVTNPRPMQFCDPSLGRAAFDLQLDIRLWYSSVTCHHIVATTHAVAPKAWLDGDIQLGSTVSIDSNIP